MPKSKLPRRAYRDGDNEYLLNGQRVRLQDITDVLAQTGLGKRTYALIGQGLIDKVLSLAPEELRSLFEEAAGITGYQAKRTIALRRLEATQQNLTRIQDIIAELSPRLGYLRRQAERARERDQIANDLRGMFRDWYGYHWHTKLTELERSRTRAQELKDGVSAHQRGLEQLTQSISYLREQQTDLRNTLAELHRQSSKLHRTAEVVGRDLAVAQERLRQVQAREEESRRELAPLRLQQESLAARIAATETAIQVATSEYQRRQSDVDALQTAVNQRQQERLRLQEDLNTARRKLTALQTKQTEYNSRLRQIEERSSALQQEQKTLAQDRVKATNEAGQAEETLQQIGDQVRARGQQTASIENDIHQIQAHVDRLRQELDEAQKRRQDAERVLDRHRTRFDLLNRLQSEGAGYASGVRAVLQASRPVSKQGSAAVRAPISGILGAVASLVRVPPELDKAIEIALGGAIQNVVTRNWSDTQNAIEFLKRTGNGRATFLPLDRLSVPSALRAPIMPGVLGNAAELVDYDASVADAILQLLNRVWITENLTSARAALDTIRGGPRPTVVTLEGEIVRSGGAVTGGSDQTRRDESMLARET